MDTLGGVGKDTIIAQLAWRLLLGRSDVAAMSLLGDTSSSADYKEGSGTRNLDIFERCFRVIQKEIFCTHSMELFLLVHL